MTAILRFLGTRAWTAMLVGALATFGVFLVDQRTQAQEEATVLYDSNSARVNLKKSAVNERRKDGDLLDANADASDNAPTNVVFMSEDDDAADDDANAAPLASKSFQATPIAKPTCDVMIDLRHAHDFSEYPLEIDDHYYHRIYSFNKAFEYLKSLGVRVEKYDRDEPLDDDALSQCKLLFFNLPSGDKAPFLVSEIFALKRFVQNGGSIFFISDHTNCYFHQSRLEPLWRELEIEPQFYGVCDNERALGTGSGWIYFDDFDNHPVVAGMRELAFQTGGGVDPKNAVAWSSATAWQDAPGMPIYGETDLAYYGNFSRDEGERVGPSGVVLAKEFGKGRIVVVGDQNVFSAFFLQYLDAYRLWINAFAWLLDKPEIADAREYAARAKYVKTILCCEDLRRDAKRFGDPDANGYYHLYAFLCRRYNMFCLARKNDALDAPIVALLEGKENYEEECFELAYEQLASGKAVLAIDPPYDVWERPNSELVALLKKLQENGVENDLETGDGEASENVVKSRKFVERIALSNGAKLILVRGRYSYDNSTVPKPEAVPLLLQQQNLQTLLDEIENIFNEEKDVDAQNDADGEEKDRLEQTTNPAS